MRKVLISFLLFCVSFLLNSQTVHPDLGLNGHVTWLSDTMIRVEYDWSADSQLLDWTKTKGSKLILENGGLTITEGPSSVPSMVWKQLIRCTRIYAENVKAVSPEDPHLNFITNVAGWTGFDFNPPEIIGVLYKADGNAWLDNEELTTLPGPSLMPGGVYTIDINITDTSITTISSSNAVLYSKTLSSPPENDRQVALGGWGGDTGWGKVIVEGYISPPVQIPPDMIAIQSNGDVFAPVIEVTGSPVIEWIFADSGVSSSATPTKDYGSIGVRYNYLKVTPWSALIGINVGYDAEDGGYGDFDRIPSQNVSAFFNLELAKNSLEYLCASHNPLTRLDLREMQALRFIELLGCNNLQIVRLDSHPVLERICFENCNLDSLNLSGCTALEDLRASRNYYTTINWGSIGDSLWHLCVRTNPQLTENLPDLTQFPVLYELLTWDDNQTGAFVVHSPVIHRIDAYDNHYTSADISGCTDLRQFSLSGSKLDSLNLGTAYSLTYLRLEDCGLSGSQADYVLKTLDLAGRSDGYLELTLNEAPTAAGLVHLESLKEKGWTIKVPVVLISEIFISSADGTKLISTDSGTIQLIAEVLPENATDQSFIWSIVNETGNGTIDSTGLVTAVDNGTVTVVATANDSSGVTGTYVVTITSQGVTGSVTITGDEPLAVITNNNEIRIQLNDSYINWKADLYNLQGKLLKSRLVENDIFVFDISSMPSGIYIVVLSKEGKRKFAKVPVITH